MFKTCPDCKESKVAEDNFYKNRSRPGGFGAYCKACTAVRAKAKTPEQKEAARLRYADWASKNCRKAYGKTYYSKNKTALNEKSKKWREANAQLFSELQRKWRNENPDYRLALRLDYRRKNPNASHEYYVANRDKILARCREWKVENAEKVRRYAGTRRAALLQRTPGWLTAEDFKEMDFTYLCAHAYSKESGVPHHVDHIYPLQGRYVSGLHVPSNLQVLTGTENLKKSNLWVPE